MARSERLFVPGHPYFILLQASNGTVCFHDGPCYRQYMNRLLNCLAAYQVRLHAYVLMPNEVQLLLTPATPFAIASLMKVVNNAYAQYFNTRFDRCGYLFKALFKSSVMLSQEAVLQCQKYIELAPVRERLVRHPGVYQWSSYCLNAFGGHGKKITPHDQYQQFSLNNPKHCESNRFKRYREFLAMDFTASQYEILDKTYRSRPAGYHATSMPRVRAVKRLHSASNRERSGFLS